MPRTLEFEGGKWRVATDAELLDFANAIREAGGADPLEALLSSSPGEVHSCLIANALNFGCSVDTIPWSSDFADGSARWAMYLPSNLTPEQTSALGKIKGVRLRWDEYSEAWYLTLPKHIGNAAWAFDEGAAFTEYRKGAVKS